MRLISVFILFVDITLLTGSILAHIIPPRSEQTYIFDNEVTTEDLKHSTRNIGYKLKSTIRVASLWNDENAQLLRLKLDNFKISTIPKGTTKHFNDLNDHEFYVYLDTNKPIQLFVQDNDEVSILNLKRGIASLFQFKYNTGILKEEDISGECSVSYHSKSSTKFDKTKSDCSNWALKIHKRSDKPIGVSVKSSQQINYILTQDGLLNKLHSVEKHSAYLDANSNAGNSLESIISLTHELLMAEVDQLNLPDVNDIASQLQGYKKVPIQGDIDGKVNKEETKIKTQIKNFLTEMKEENFGKEGTSLILTKLLPAARNAKSEELVQILKAHSTQEIRSQFLDLLGATQTIESHLAFTNSFQFDNEEDYAPIERYLQALSVGTRPKSEIIENIFEQIASKNFSNTKLQDTTVQTLAAMTKHYTKLSTDGFENVLVKQVENLFQTQLTACEKVECKLIYVRGLHNLQMPSTIQTLIGFALGQDTSLSVAAIKALRSFPVKYFDENDKKNFEKMFYRISRKFDSTVRTNALDILLDMKPNRDELQYLLEYLSSNDKDFEVKTYVLQRLTMISDKCPRFKAMIKSILKQIIKVNNYHVLAQKGLTTALQRGLSQSPSFNGSLISLQEVSDGVLKQGIVDMIVEAGNEKFSVFKLGLYSAGLSSFMGGSDEDQDPENSVTPTAGMELVVQGVYMRPLEFFSGQGELMGHVWSGTASDPTPAYQATTLLHDHEEYILLADGSTVYLRVLGATSIDLTGQLQFSLWNRNAHSQVDKNAGIAVTGLMSLRTSFTELENQYSITQEPMVKLISDVDFYLDILMCLQLGLPESILRHNISKKVWLLDSNISESNKISYTYKLPGRTLALNQKNNEMCAKIHF